MLLKSFAVDFYNDIFVLIIFVDNIFTYRNRPPKPKGLSLLGLCFMQRLLSGLSGICAGQLVSSNLRGPSLQALTLFGGVGFIAWRLRCPSLGECRWGPRHFWDCWTHVGFSPVPRPTKKKDLLPHVYAWWGVWQIPLLLSLLTKIKV